MTFDSFFHPKPYVGSLEPLIGLRLAGIYFGIRWRQGEAQVNSLAGHVYKAQSKWEQLEKKPVGAPWTLEP